MAGGVKNLPSIIKRKILLLASIVWPPANEVEIFELCRDTFVLLEINKNNHLNYEHYKKV